MKPGFEEVAQEIASHLTPEASAKILKQFQQMMRDKPKSDKPSIKMEDCDFIIMEHSVRPDGPCICGSPKLFRDCCGEKIVATKNPDK